jgi:hypothetical protein
MREDQIDQAERREVLENDRRVREQQQAQGSTFHARAQAQAGELSGGRFASLGAPRVIGATPNPSMQYPAASSAHQTELPPEQPLGFSIDEMPNPTGDVSSGVSPPVAPGPASDTAPLSDLADNEQRPGAGPLSNKQAGDE